MIRILTACFLLSVFGNKVRSLNCDVNPPKNTKARLEKTLLCSYDSSLRPVKDINTISNVTLELWVQRADPDEEKETVLVEALMSLEWTDEFLTWDPTQYANISSLMGRNYDVWIPDIRSAEWKKPEDNVQMMSGHMTISNKGHVWLYSLMTIRGGCSSDTTYWPYDSRTCKVLLSASDYDNRVTYNFDVYTKEKELIDSSLEWKLTNFSKAVMLRDSDILINAGDELIVLHMTFERHTFILSASYIFPALVLVFLSILPFWLAHSIAYRLFINIATASLQIYYLVSLNTILWSNGTNSILLVSFYRDSLFISFVGIVITWLDCMILKRAEQSSSQVSAFLDMLTMIPYIGQLFSYFMNTARVQGSDTESDRTILITTPTVKLYQEWLMLINVIDKLVFFLLLFLMLIMWITLIPS